MKKRFATFSWRSAVSILLAVTCLWSMEGCGLLQNTNAGKGSKSRPSRLEKCKQSIAEARKELRAIESSKSSSADALAQQMKKLLYMRLRFDWSLWVRKLGTLESSACLFSREKDKHKSVALAAAFTDEITWVERKLWPRFIRVLIAESQLATAARLFDRFFNAYDEKVFPGSDALARKLGVELNVALVANVSRKFEKYGKVGQVGRERTDCIFSRQQIAPDANPDEVDFSYFFSGEEPIHLLCRLPLAAEAYDRTDARFYLNLKGGRRYPGQKTHLCRDILLGTPQSKRGQHVLSFVLEPTKLVPSDRQRMTISARILLKYTQDSRTSTQRVVGDTFHWYRGK